MTSPVYSVDAQCRDCYKCVRHCPVKAIRVENDHAAVTPQTCILCGRCVSVCSHSAKQVRDDLPRARALLRRSRTVHASLAPSFVSEFPDVSPAQLATALQRLGFAGVHETAEGAERVSQEVAVLLDKAHSGLFLSTACPVAVELITRYHPEFAADLTPVMPPMLAHAAQLKARFGADAQVIFIGPCIGKKRDADQTPDLIHTALTFEELRRWLIVTGIDPRDMPDAPDYAPPGEGAFYPIEGGMNQTIRQFLKRRDLDDALLTVGGLDHIDAMLKTLGPRTTERPLFLELLACEGGCIAGPKISAHNTVVAHLDVLAHARAAVARTPAPAKIAHAWPPQPVETPAFSEEQIAGTLRSLGKYQKEDELNCGGCGYDSCRALAHAVLQGVAEPQMCVSHMRQLAQKKTNALALALPYGLVIADAHLRIMECNERFAKLFGDTLATAYESRPGLRDADLTRILPFPRLFKAVLDSGHEIIRKSVKLDAKIFSVTVFNVDPHTVFGALILDITETEQRRQQLIEKSRTVIQNTTKTVQEIAYMLGKNSAQSELILNSAIDMFSAEAPDEPESKSLSV
jgi:iron only hydrogenase large subunit-like protein